MNFMQEMFYEIKQQMKEDLGQVKKGLDMILPPTVSDALGKAFTQAFDVLKPLVKSVSDAAGPKIQSLVLEEGSPVRRAAIKLKEGVVAGGKKLLAKINGGGDSDGGDGDGGEGEGDEEEYEGGYEEEEVAGYEEEEAGYGGDDEEEATGYDAGYDAGYDRQGEAEAEGEAAFA
mmetsp:Transcript_35305/g.94582  ORF Transcript_35305/g.94582 Transcript_35305/m.94582 type:complete len:174 (+) Transcript_35305:368-889(+)